MPLVLASLNLHGGRQWDGTPFNTESACVQLGATVIALQEVWRPGGGPDPVGAAAATLGAEAIHLPQVNGITLQALNIAADPAPGSFGLAVISSLPVTGQEVFPLGRGPGDQIPRVALAITVRLPDGGLLRIVNTHLTHRFTSPVQLVRLTRLLRPARVPTVIAGDLNMPGPVTELAAEYSPAVGGRTFPAHRPALQLDHILTGAGVTGTGGEVLPAVGSDHLPIRAQLTVHSGFRTR